MGLGAANFRTHVSVWYFLAQRNGKHLFRSTEVHWKAYKNTCQLACIDYSISYCGSTSIHWRYQLLIYMTWSSMDLKKLFKKDTWLGPQTLFCWKAFVEADLHWGLGNSLCQLPSGTGNSKILPDPLFYPCSCSAYAEKGKFYPTYQPYCSVLCCLVLLSKGLPPSVAASGAECSLGRMISCFWSIDPTHYP